MLNIWTRFVCLKNVFFVLPLEQFFKKFFRRRQRLAWLYSFILQFITSDFSMFCFNPSLPWTSWSFSSWSLLNCRIYIPRLWFPHHMSEPLDFLCLHKISYCRNSCHLPIVFLESKFVVIYCTIYNSLYFVLERHHFVLYSVN